MSGTGSDSRDLVRIAKDEGLLAMLAATLSRSDAIVTGALGTEKLHLYMIPGRLVQAARNGSFVAQLAREFDHLRAKGRIKPGFEHSPEGKSSLQELLAALEEPPVDDDKFSALKAIYLAAAANDSPPPTVPPQLLMALARQLSTGALISLATAYKIARDPEHPPGSGPGAASRWMSEVATRSGLGSVSLVELYEAELGAKYLVNKRMHADRSGMDFGSSFGLSDLGVRLCEFLETGRAMANEVAAEGATEASDGG